MQITKIAKMGSEDKFAVFIDDILKIVLSGQSILDLGITVGQKVSDEEVKNFSNYSDNEKLYAKALKYISVRLRSEDEMKSYLKRKEASQEQIRQVISKLKDLGLINDEYYVEAFIHDKLMLKPASRRKITYELRKKKISENIIQMSLEKNNIDDKENLKRSIEIKRRQSRFSDDLKLMQYLVRSGYNYSDVKEALRDTKH